MRDSADFLEQPGVDTTAARVHWPICLPALAADGWRA